MYHIISITICIITPNLKMLRPIQSLPWVEQFQRKLWSYLHYSSRDLISILICIVIMPLSSNKSMGHVIVLDHDGPATETKTWYVASTGVINSNCCTKISSFFSFYFFLTKLFHSKTATKSHFNQLQQFSRRRRRQRWYNLSDYTFPVIVCGCCRW